MNFSDEISFFRKLVRQYRWSFNNEREMQNQFAEMLKAEKVPYAREFKLSDKDRPDFMVGEAALEVKTYCGLEKHLRQLKRYADHPDVKSTVLVSTRPIIMPETLSGKPTGSIMIHSAFNL